MANSKQLQNQTCSPKDREENILGQKSEWGMPKKSLAVAPVVWMDNNMHRRQTHEKKAKIKKGLSSGRQRETTEEEQEGMKIDFFP